MVHGRHYSNYQKGIIRRYYENRDTLMRQKLGEIVSDLYLASEAPKQSARLWKQALDALLKAGAHPAQAKRIVEEKDLEGLARLTGELF